MASSRRAVLAALALAATACAGPASTAGGRAAPRLELLAAGGEAVTLEALRAGHDATVVVFWSAGCPCVLRYQERVDALLDAYPADRVRVIGVSSNAGEPFHEVLAAAAARRVRIPIYRDPSGEVAETLGARSTPTVAVLDREGRVRFLGWIDNERRPGEAGRQPWLEQALDGILAGRTGFAARAPVYGCAITRSLFGPRPGACCTAH